MAALKTLLENLDVTVVRGRLELDITDVVYDSRKITKGCLFICIEMCIRDRDIRMSVTYYPSLNTYQGNTKLQLVMQQYQ